MATTFSLKQVKTRASHGPIPHPLIWSPIQLLPVLDLINDIYRESDCFDKSDLLTPLMTSDPDEKNAHVQRQNALLKFKLNVSALFSSGDKNHKA